MQSRVCDPAICNGTDALKFLTRPAQLQERFTPSQLEIYISDLSTCFAFLEGRA